MCLILFAHSAHPRYSLVLAANRDEFFERPTRAAHWWEDAPEVLAGRDLRGGGSWMGVTRSGRWAAVTNFREMSSIRADAPSRGALVSDFLRGDLPPERYLSELQPRAGAFNGFNLLVGDASGAWWLSNHGAGVVPVSPGVHGLSNHLLDTPWPKVERGRRELERVLASPEPDIILDLLLDRTLAADHLLPDTGVGQALERELSASFILTPDYGTRSSTALLISHDGTVLLRERTFRPASQTHRSETFEFAVA